jgi:hypothetical protein
MKDRKSSEDYCLLLRDIMNSHGFLATFQRNHRMVIKMNTHRGVATVAGGVRLLGEAESKGRQNEYFKFLKMCGLNKLQIIDKIEVNLMDNCHLKVRNSCHGRPLLLFKPDIKTFSYAAVYIYHTTRHHVPQYSIAMFRNENFAVVGRTAPVHMLVQLW